MPRKYILDANVLITASKNMYPIDIFPSFWNTLLDKATNKEFCLTEEVVEELNRGNDQLKDWLNNNIDCFEILKSNNQKLIDEYSLIIQSVVDNDNYYQSAKDEFASIADSWLIAHAKNNNYIIVTQEKLNINSKKRIMIPNVCNEFNIEYIDIVQFMRECQFHF